MTQRARPVLASTVPLDWLAVVMTAVFTIRVAFDRDPAQPKWLLFPAAIIAVATLYWRRTWPEPVLAVTLLAVLAGVAPFAAALALGTVADRFGLAVRTWIWVAVASCCVLVPTFLVSDLDLPGSRPAAIVYVLGAVVALPLLVGLYLNSRTQQIRVSEARQHDLEAARDVEIERARASERARIAREMHDVVAHRVSLISLQAGALEMSAEGTPAAETAAVIRATAHQALEELRQAVGVLRTDDAPNAAPLSPQPEYQDLAGLVAEWRAAGVRVTLHDESADGSDDVPATTGRAAYRVVQEALTNASKHASGAPVDVVLNRTAGRLVVEIANGPGMRKSSRADSGGGVGLVGLRERVELLGGDFAASGDESGAFTIRAALPAGSG